MENNDKKTDSGEQENIGYDNTENWTDDDQAPNNRVQTTDTGKDEGPEEKKEDSAGLRAESGKKTHAGETGNKERGGE